MKYIIALILLSVALPAQAQTAPKASSIVAPQAIATPAPAPTVVIMLARDATANGPWSNSTLSVPVGDTVEFTLEPPGVPLPSTLAVSANGVVAKYGTGAPMGFVADEAGIWRLRIVQPGYSSNELTVTAR